MRAAFRWALRVTAFLVGIVGTWAAQVRNSIEGRVNEYVVLLGISFVVMLLLIRGKLWKGVPECLLSLLMGVILAVGAITYGWSASSLTMLGVTLISGIVLEKSSVLQPVRSVIGFGMVVVTCQWGILVADHLILHGRVYSLKWLSLDHPIFGPSEPLQAERDERRAIYLYDMSRCLMTNYQAVVWGWTVFPNVVELGESMPTKPLASHPMIQEVIQ